ncbi:acyl-CoA-binding domain-containing protein 3 isoform X2 [Nicotiana tabacum]|uniref:Acyl-CoA-binding domain-containing protein 3 isoform X1 n=2 Tax=Nicotiana TaxID=4085 RepID=A0A1S3XV31_TOBAC|nr:PREDICTED: acyl-CoA-binding domain-containing protein 3-like isoform X1 [Nicotiana sylvestris]XP_016443552.1 PREDICTED: acyl-CoA-binding domain-containing protein 3-like isoform X1 [Nicotiana tabacum]
MLLFQEFFVTAMAALVFSCIIVKFISIAVLNNEKIDKEKTVVEEAKITKGLVVKSRKSKKRVKFVEKEVVKNVDHIELTACKVGGVVDQSENGGEKKVDSEEVFVEEKNEDILKKSDEFNGEKILENVGVIINEKRDEDSDDDWEGIERSELEKEFVKAVNFVDSGKGKENLGSELMMQLYGLQKIAMEGPCYEPQPMALKVYARAKWNAWQRMGSMNPEVAMEQYIKLLSDHVPGWTHQNKEASEVGSSETNVPRDPDSIPDSFNDISKDERTQEINHAAEEGDIAGSEKAGRICSL